MRKNVSSSLFSLCVFTFSWSMLMLDNGVRPFSPTPTPEEWARSVRIRNFVNTACEQLDGAVREEIAASVMDAASAHRLEPEVLLAVMSMESRCEPKAKSQRGAVGLMQLMPQTASWLGVKNPYEVRSNIHGGAKYLSLLLKDFRGDLRLALAAYNAGPKVVRKLGKVPPYKETRSYVRAVLRTYTELNQPLKA